MRTFGAYPQVAWSPVPAGTLLRDLNRLEHVFDENRKLQYVFARVQLIRGAETEGVSGSLATMWNTGWICVWSAIGTAPIFT